MIIIALDKLDNIKPVDIYFKENEHKHHFQVKNTLGPIG